MVENLRDYQIEMLSRLEKAWKRSRSVMVQMPTGTGKTHLMAAVIREHLDERILVVAHRIELIEQISRTLDRFGIEHGLIISGKPVDDTKGVQVASIQTLSRRLEKISFTPSLVIIDEAHHALADTYRILWEHWQESKFLGLTATPCRLNGNPFTDLFDVLLQSWSIREYIQEGWLSDLDYVSVRSDSKAVQQIARLDRRGADGDFQTKQMALVLDVPESIEHLYQSYKKYADGMRGIVYAIDRNHAQHIAEYYMGHGVSCAAIDFKTPPDERQQLVSDYRAGKLKVLIGISVFEEGFDCPDVQFIQLARPTMSLSKYLQQVGRGMRVTESKKEVIILDQVGLYLMFGLPTSDRNWQATFLGRASGKGVLRVKKGTNIKGEETEKTLVNEEMFRVKSIVRGNDEVKKNSSYEVAEQQANAIDASDEKKKASNTKDAYLKSEIEDLKRVLPEHKKVLLQIPPYVDKASVVKEIADHRIFWWRENTPLDTEIQKILVVVNEDRMVDPVMKSISIDKNHIGAFSGTANPLLKKRRIVVCSQKSLATSFVNFAMSYSPLIVIIWDANKANPLAFQSVFRTWPKAWVIGLTFAPCDIRYSQRIRLFEKVKPAESLRESAGKGMIKSVKLFSMPYTGRTRACMKKVTMDALTDEITTLLMQDENIEHIYESYKKHADGRRGVIMAYNPAHAEKIVACFSCHGVKAKGRYAHDRDELSDVANALRSGDATVIVSCPREVLFPEVGFIQMTYPLPMLSDYLNTIFSYMKASSVYRTEDQIAESDDMLVVIDNTLMSKYYGQPTEEHDWQKLFAESQILVTN